MTTTQEQLQPTCPARNLGRDEGEQDWLQIPRPEGLSDEAWDAIMENTDRYLLAVEISLLPPTQQEMVRAEVRRLLHDRPRET